MSSGHLWFRIMDTHHGTGKSISSILKANLAEIYGPVKENELWRIRQNELEAIIKGESIVRFVKCQRIRWLGHIERIQDTEIPKKEVRKAVRNETKRKTKNEMAG